MDIARTFGGGRVASLVTEINGREDLVGSVSSETPSLKTFFSNSALLHGSGHRAVVHVLGASKRKSRREAPRLFSVSRGKSDSAQNSQPRTCLSSDSAQS